jgi:hypothetical protein
LTGTTTSPASAYGTPTHEPHLAFNITASPMSVPGFDKGKSNAFVLKITTGGSVVWGVSDTNHVARNVH